MLTTCPFITAHESIGHIPAPLLYIDCPHLRLRLPDPNEAIFNHWQANAPAQFSGEKTGLIITPLSQPSGMKRNADQSFARQGILL